MSWFTIQAHGKFDCKVIQESAIYLYLISSLCILISILKYFALPMQSILCLGEMNSASFICIWYCRDILFMKFVFPLKVC
jgi:hypothetical protein